MKGIQFVVDDSGKKTAVLIDLNEWGDVWEDVYDILVTCKRRSEARMAWETLKAETAGWANPTASDRRSPHGRAR